MRLICPPFALLLVVIFSLSVDAQLSENSILKTSTKTQQVGGLVTVTAPTTNASPEANISIALNATNTTGLNVTGYDGSILFDPAVLQYTGCTRAGTIFSDAQGFCNLFPTPNSIDFTAAGIFPVIGAGPILIFNFTAIGSAGQMSPLTFTFMMFNEGDPANVTVDGLVTLAFPPTSANTSVSGRVMTAQGSAVRNARIVMTDADGVARSAVSNAFGYFRVDDLPAGATYSASIWAKGHTFQPITISVLDEVTGLEIYAEP